MSSETQEKFYALNEWFSCAQGQEVANAFAHELLAVPSLSGQNLLQIGACGENAWLSALRYTHPWVVSMGPGDKNVLSSVHALPFEKHSFDCVVCPLSLEMFLNRKHFLDEIDFILKSNGYLIFLGMNPFSLWGIGSFLGSTCFRPFAGQLRSAFFLKRTLMRRSYRLLHLSHFYFLPPISNPSFLKKMRPFGQLNRYVRLCPGGFYCLVMQKYQSTPAFLFADEELLFRPQRLPL